MCSCHALDSAEPLLLLLLSKYSNWPMQERRHSIYLLLSQASYTQLQHNLVEMLSK